MQRSAIIIFLVAITLIRGEGIALEKDQLAKVKAQAEAGVAEAQIQLGMCYRDGRGVEKDYEKALKWYRACADQGNSEGMDNVGFMHLRGWGVPESFDIAAGYFKASAAKNHAQGQFNMGNCYFSGQGVEQNYDRAIDYWERAAKQGHENATWRLATLQASGEGVPLNRDKAEELCRQNAQRGHAEGALLLGHLLSLKANSEESTKWLKFAAEQGSSQAKTLLKLDAWKNEEPATGKRGYVEVDHLYQGWNNCGATSIAMLARHYDAESTPYDVKRMCPQNPIGTGTDWQDLVAVCDKLDQDWEMVTFPNSDKGFKEGAAFIRNRLDKKQPVVIDFTYVRERNGRKQSFGHTLLVVGYNMETDTYVLKNPNQPPPGIEVATTEELKAQWYSRGYSRLAKGKAARPLIVVGGD